MSNFVKDIQSLLSEIRTGNDMNTKGTTDLTFGTAETVL